MGSPITRDNEASVPAPPAVVAQSRVSMTTMGRSTQPSRNEARAWRKKKRFSLSILYAGNAAKNKLLCSTVKSSSRVFEKGEILFANETQPVTRFSLNPFAKAAGNFWTSISTSAERDLVRERPFFKGKACV